jgi:hypothetical protein
MPILDFCDNVQFCGGMCEPPARLCPDCLRQFEDARLRREALEAAKIERKMDKLEKKPRRPAWWKVIPE